MEDDSFFPEDSFSTFDRDLKNKKIMVPMNPEGGARTAPRAPRLISLWHLIVVITALRSRCGHYIISLGVYLSSSSSFPPLLLFFLA